MAVVPRRRGGARCLLCSASAALLALALLARSADAAANTDRCPELGFTGLALCSDCDALESAVRDEALAAECRLCCAEDAGGDAAAGPFHSAALEVCSWRLAGEVKAFVDGPAKAYPPEVFQLKLTPGSPPTLVLRGAGKAGATHRIRVDGWKADTVAEYLRSKLSL